MIRFEGVSFTYADSQTPSLRDVDLSIEAGEVVLLCGASGCGKTTLTRMINGLIPHYFAGMLRGRVTIGDRDIAAQPIQDTARMVGSVFQNPRTQFFNIDVTSELVFRCENLAVPPDAMDTCLRELTAQFALEPFLDRSLFQLSGGEKQKIACAAVSAPMPEIFVLDEPTSNLDWQAIAMLHAVIAQWKLAGKTVIVAEHRLSYLQGLADRVIFMENGAIANSWPAETFWQLPSNVISAYGLRAVRPLSSEHFVKKIVNGPPFVVEGLAFHYKEGKGIEVPQLTLSQGAVIAVLGANGAGKTTFARCLCGLERRGKGTVVYDGKQLNRRQRLKQSYLVMQDVGHQLFTESVADEVAVSLRSGAAADDECRVAEILEALDLSALSTRHPLSLSGGQMQRVAVASAIASEKEWLIFDEPTSGLDHRHMQEVATVLRQLSALGKTVFIITHDPELVAACCDAVIFIKAGRVAWSGPLDQAHAELVHNFFKTEMEV